MPRGDRTGPLGIGPMTGRGAGFCSGFRIPGFANPIFGRGMGLGIGRGMGMRRGRGFGRMFWLAGLLPAGAYMAYRWAKRSNQR